MKVVFLGTPEIAAAALSALIELKQELLVITRPDKPAGRGMKTSFSPVKALALSKNIAVLQPEKVGLVTEQVKTFKPDVIFCCAYGQMIPDEILAIPPLKAINIHASILPKYRGGAPIHWAVINGEKRTGITYMYMVKKMDAGPVLGSRDIAIGEEDTTGDVFKKMEFLVKESLLKDFARLTKPDVKSSEQDHEKATYAPIIKREDEWLSFDMTAEQIVNKVRGLAPRPGAYFTHGGMEIKVLKAVKGELAGYAPGEVIAADKKGILIGARDGTVLLTVLQIPGKRAQEVSKAPHMVTLFAEGERLS